MTQNFNTPTSDKRDDTQPSSEIRADIDQTRASVGDKIDQLQARLDPNRLKEQAQETVQEMINDTANSMTEYVKTHKDEMISSLTESARRNPLPTALIGLGIGWLILESMGGNKSNDRDDNRRSSSRDDRWEYERRYLSNDDQRNRFEGTSGRSQVSQGRGQYDDYSNGPSGSTGYPTRSEFQSSQGYGNGQQQGSNPLAKATDAVKDKVGDVADSVKDSVGGVGQDIKDRVSDAGQEIKERVGDVGQEIKERVSDVRERISDAVGGAVGDVRQQANHMGEQTQNNMYRAGNQVDEWQNRARYEGQRRSQQVMRNLEDNPLTYGAIALAAGAAIALLLPQTRTENRYFGEMRDQVVEKGQEVVETAKGHAQEVVAEIRPELEEKARQIVSDVKETGKTAIQDAANELRPIVDKAVEKGKEEAGKAAEAVGIDPSKLTNGTASTTEGTNQGKGTTQGAGQGSTQANTQNANTQTANTSQGKTPVINRDTLRGQWNQVKGEVKSKWGQLTDDELTKTEGDYEKLVGSIQTRYGYTRGRVEQELNEWFNSRKA